MNQLNINKKQLLGLFLLLQYLIISFPSSAASISDSDKHAWGENSGWYNFKPTSNNQVKVYDDHLEGYIWSEKVGWIRLGTHTTGGTHHYSNNSATTYGVNRDGSGNLSGYAWSENIGWINFNSAHHQVSINATSGDFDGYAWSEKVGWIHFQHTSSPAYKVTVNLNENSNCSPNTITITNIQYTEDMDTKSEISIASDGTVRVTSISNVSYTAPIVILNSGFSAEHGSQFRATASVVNCNADLISQSGDGLLEEQPNARANRNKQVTKINDMAIVSTWLKQNELPSPLAKLLIEKNAKAIDIQMDAYGEYIVFSTQADLIYSDRNTYSDIYLYHIPDFSLSLISIDNTGEPANGPSRRPRLSGSGEYVVYQSEADNLNLPFQDKNGVSDIYLFHINTEQNNRVSWQVNGKETINPSSNPGLSIFGPYVVYDKTDKDNQRHIYAYNFTTGKETTSRYSVNTDGRGQLIHSQQPTISSDGGYIAYVELSVDQTCHIHFYDRITTNFLRTKCPPALNGEIDEWKLAFDEKGGKLKLFNLATSQKIVVKNPLFPLF